MGSKVYESTSPPPPPNESVAGGSGARPTTAVPPPPVTPGAEAQDEHKPNPAVEAFHRIRKDIDEFKEYAGYYLAARIDGVKRKIRNIGLYAALGVLGLIAGGALIATATGLLVVGFADGLSRLFGGRDWLGDIVAGVVVLGAIGVAAWVMMNKLTGSWRSQTIKKYEERKQSQRERFGHDLSHRAAQSGAQSGTAAHGPEKDQRG